MPFRVKPVYYAPSPKRLNDIIRHMEKNWKSRAQRVLDRVLPLPTPVDLGKAEHNALQSRHFTPEVGSDVYTWEDWEVEMRRDHPVSWFLRREFPRPFGRVRRRFSDALYWVQCHTLPSYRFHILDMRNPGGGVEWDYGWRDTSEVMLWMCFKLLTDFVEKEEPTNLEDIAAKKTPEQVDEELGTQLANYREMMDLYRWWKTGRLEEEEHVHALFKTYHSLRKARENPEIVDAARRVWMEAQEAHDGRDDTQLARLIAIRGHLWT